MRLELQRITEYMQISAGEAGTFLSRRGYGIKKESLSENEQAWIRKELSVRAFIPKAPVQPPEFPVYRESSTKIYVPRFFGVATYGEADACSLVKPEPMRVPFRGDLRDYQARIVESYTRHAGPGGGGLLEVPCGRGKTVVALNIAARLGLKTLVIVHKGFLVHQWQERIAQFLPGARVGRVQGPTVDIEDKDVVIAMLQSISMKSYAEGTFDGFGLTIVDECHHISSEVFSRSLQKVVTRYMLGLSATMQRKDGLTHVFKMFLGEVAYKEKRVADDSVVVKALRYTSPDSEFSAPILDYRGNPAYSAMITRLCDHWPRTEFILSVLKKEMEEQPKQQVMILSQNRSLLSNLFEAIMHREMGTAGFYVGGMKETDLKKTEDCAFVLATYGMAAEALDIKTLTTLVLATPRTDVVQAVGRILRVKHERPLVVDIVDQHQVFRRQWQKRKQYYKRQHYSILEASDKGYLKGEWDDPPGQRSKAGPAAGKCLLSVAETLRT